MTDEMKTLAQLQASLHELPGNIPEKVLRNLLVSVKGGHGGYEDLATKTTRLNGSAGVRFSYECDGEGDNTDTEFLPYPKVPDTDELWDTTNDRIRLANLPRGERLSVRLNFSLDPALPNSTVDAFAMFHNSSDVSVFEIPGAVTESKGTDDKALVSVIPFSIGPLIVDGFVYFQLKCSNDCTVEIGGVYINVMR